MYTNEEKNCSETFIKGLTARMLADLDARIDSHEHTCSPDYFKLRYLRNEMLAKLRVSSSSQFQREAGLKTFAECEEANRHFNKHMYLNRLNDFEYVPGDDWDLSSDLVKRVRKEARSIIRRAFRSFNQEAVRSIVEKEAYFGPGTNQGHKGSTLDMFKKASRLSCTRELVPFALSIINGDPAFAALQLKTKHLSSVLPPHPVCVEDSRVTTVPKNAKTDRAITVEPHLNSYLQNGLGMWMRKQLAQMTPCLDLSDQGRNQELARQASNCLKLTTVDIENASNSLTYSCVIDLFGKGSKLFRFMDLIRSRRYTVGKGTTVFEFHMFSGMGNGFTFPLESVIFYALAEACRRVINEETQELQKYCKDYNLELEKRDDVVFLTNAPHVCHFEASVYGDDIIVHNHVYPLLVPILQQYGFRVNEKKTFTGPYPFRESCGAHFYLGQSVKPFYVRSSTFENVCDAYALHNRIWEWACQDNVHFDTKVVPWLLAIQQWVRERNYRHVVYVHPSLGDVGFWPLGNLLPSEKNASTLLYNTYCVVAEKKPVSSRYSLWKMEAYLKQIGSARPNDYSRMSSRHSAKSIRKRRVRCDQYLFPYILI